jgi:RND family efflux transporter MFP subunit
MKRFWKLSELIVISLFVVFGFSCRSQKKQEVKAESLGASPVKVFKVSKQKISEKLFYTGTLEAWRRIVISPDVGGKIARIYVNEGDSVSKGQVLAEMDIEASELQLKQAEAGLAVAQAQFKDAKTNLERMDRLIKEKAVSEQQHDQVKLGFEAASAQLEQAQATVNLARHSLDVSIMKAPFSGVIASKNAEVGDIINPMMGSFGATSGVLTLVDFSRIKIRVDISSSDIHRLKKGQTATLHVPALPGQEFPGTVNVINLAADPSTKKFGIEVGVNNPGLVLRPGTFGEIVLEVNTHENVLVVPQKAILDNNHVFIAQGEKAVRRDITLGLQNTNLVEVLNGLAEGDAVIVEGNFGLEDGSPVEITGEVLS